MQPFRLYRKTTGRRGVVTAEMAICLPILFIFLFGCYETARAYMFQHAAESAAYEAARAGIVPNAQVSTCRSAAEQILRSVGVTDFSLRVSPNPILRDSPTVTVTIEVPMRSNSRVSSFFFGNTTLLGECQMQRETY